MKKITTILVLTFSIAYSVKAQTLYTVNSGNYYYYPQSVTINVGDTVRWVNDGGFHNVNFDINAITGVSYNNPESFISVPTNNTDMYTHVFTVPGNYDYDCSVGTHAANGMVGSVIVNSVSSTIFVSSKNKVIESRYNIFGRKVNNNFKGLIILKYKDGSVEKKYITD